MSGVEAIVSTVKGIGDKIRSFLHFSRPDEGPLRDYETWMPDFTQGLAKGIMSNIPVVAKATKALASSMVITEFKCIKVYRLSESCQCNCKQHERTTDSNIHR